nr:CPBP family intramembrane glutamic endopeptidase [Sporosarcina limicola]
MSSIIILPMVLFAPFLEELIFRRVIFGGIYLKTNFWIATIVSAVVFAAVHNEFQHLLMYMMPAFAFAFVYYKTKRILAPMLAHLLMNGFVTIMQLNLDKIQKYLQQFEDMKQTFIIFFN